MIWVYITEYNGIEWDMYIHICTSIYYVHVYCIHIYIYIISIICVLFTYISLHIYIFIYNYTYIARGLTFAHLTCFPEFHAGPQSTLMFRRVFFANCEHTKISILPASHVIFVLPRAKLPFEPCLKHVFPKLQCFEPLTETATNQKALKEPPK